MDYKLIFGIEVPRLKEIASQYEKNHDLAQALWKENIRECQILALSSQSFPDTIPDSLNVTPLVIVIRFSTVTSGRNIFAQV